MTLLCSLFAVVACSTSVDLPRFKTLDSHIPIKIKELSNEGKVDPDRELVVTIALNLNNKTNLIEKIRDIYEPGNPHYHQFLTPQEFHSLYSPTEEQVAAVRDFLISQGVQPLSMSANRLLIEAKGSLGHLSSMFHTEIHVFRDKLGHSFIAPVREFQVPMELPIQAVYGLQDVIQLKSYHRFLSSQAIFDESDSNQDESQSLSQNLSQNLIKDGIRGLTPQGIKKAYQLPLSLDGSGQRLALFELDGFNESDITQYENQFGLASVPITTIQVGGATGKLGQGAAEVTLDIELMIALADHASGILVYEGPNTMQGVIEVYNRMADDNLANQMSTSWGLAENLLPISVLQTENHIFMQMAAQGQAFFGASGDWGAYDRQSILVVDDPSAQPYVVGVGGTKLMTQSEGEYLSETTWHDSGDGKIGDSKGGAGGGGISAIWAQPDWQRGAVSALSGGSQTMRNVPDVSLNSDPKTGYAIFFQGKWSVMGGTSCAAPLWAAFTALVNQQRELIGNTSLGFPNPALYRIAKGSRYHSDFYDIADGSDNLYYHAVPGYDNATGWGSFQAQNLLYDLSQDLK